MIMAAKRPNILMIVCDQLRYDSLGFAGDNAVLGGPVKTPNLDALAARGLWFENAYTSLPTCCPARQSMLAGVRAETFGALWNYDITSRVACLTPDQPNWPTNLHNAGYRMAYVGKWHVNPEQWPPAFGYDKYTGYEHYAAWRSENHPDAAIAFDWFGGVDPAPLEATPTHWLAQKAIDHINEYTADAEADAPWHVRLDFSEPHLACYPAQPFAGMYDPAELAPWPSFEDSFEGKPYIQKQHILNWTNENRTWDDWSRYMAAYFGVISQVDDAVGRVLAALEASGQADNTVILFTADHGDMAGSHRMMDKHYVLYDDVTHVPLILAGPGTEPRRISGFVNNCLDMAATVFDLTGCERFDTVGRSLLPQLQNRGEEGLRDHALTTLNGQQFGLFSQRMLRTHEWKYIWNLTDVDELYDMQNDPWELDNRIYDPAVKDILAQLRLKLHGLLKAEDPDIIKTGGWIERQLLEGVKL